MGTLTLYMDESTVQQAWTDEGPFVVGGVAFAHDDTELAALAEEEFYCTQRPKKGADYKTRSFADLASFLIKHDVLPIAAYSTLSPDERSSLKTRIEGMKDDPRATNPLLPSYKNPYAMFWTYHVAVTVVPTIINIAMWRSTGVTDVCVHQHRFKDVGETDLLKIQQERANSVEHVLRHLSVFDRKLPLPLFAILKKRVLGLCGRITFEWSASGRCAQLADAVCALRRRSLSGDSEAAKIWEKLEENWRDEHGRPPLTMRHDVTEHLRSAFRLPTPESRP